MRGWGCAYLVCCLPRLPVLILAGYPINPSSSSLTPANSTLPTIKQSSSIMSSSSSSSPSSLYSTSDHGASSRTPPPPRSPRSPRSPRYYHGLRIETALSMPGRLDIPGSPGKSRGHGRSAPTTPSGAGVGGSSPDRTTGPGFVAMFSGPQYKSSGHVVGYAPEGTRSRCRVCGTALTPNKMRFGTFFAHADGFIFLRWHHMRCVRPPSSLEDVTKLSGYGDLQPQDLQRVQNWVDGADFSPASPPLSPRTASRTSPSFESGSSSPRVGSPLSRQTTGHTNDELCSSTTSMNSIMSSDNWEYRPRNKGPGRRSPCSPRSPLSPSQPHRIVELASNPTTLISATRPRPGIGLTIDTAAATYFTPITSPLGASPTAGTTNRSPSSRGKGGGGGDGSGVFSSSPPRSGFLIDDKLPSPREMSRGRKIKSRAKSSFFALTGRHGKGGAEGGGVELTAEEKKFKTESDRLRRAARTERHRRRSKTM